MNFTLAYCIENKNVAQEFDAHLRMAGHTFDHISCDQVRDDEGLEKRIHDPNMAVILLISDNFLKSTECMYRALFLIQSNIKTQHIQTIIIDGEYEEDGVLKPIPTSFDRVSNVIQYMNYWQERYLDMRKEKREAEVQDPAFDAHLKIVRSVSSEVGEFLRVLRGTDFWTYDQFIYNDYEVFFEAMDQEPEHQSFKEKLKHAPPITINQDRFIAPNRDVVKQTDVAVSQEDPVQKLPPQPIESVPEESIIEEVPPTTAPVKEAIPIPEEHFLANAKEVTPMVEIEEEDQEEEEEQEEEKVEEGPMEYPEIEQTDEAVTDKNGESPLLDKLIDYQKEQMAGKKVVEISREQIAKNLAEAAKKEKEMELDLSIANNDNNSHESFEILQSIFEDDQEDIQDEDNGEYEDDADLFQEAPPNNEEDVIDVSEEISGPNSYALNSKVALQKAKTLITSGETDRGLKIIENLLEDEPYNTNLRYLFASYLAHPAKNYNASIDQLEELILIDPKNINAYQLLAQLAEDQNDFLLAKSYYEKVLTLDNRSPEVFYNLGAILDTYFEEQRKKAGKYFRKVIKMDPLHVDARYRYALILADIHGKPQKAVDHLKEVLLVHPNHPFANYDIALMYYQLKKRKKAARFYQKAYTINPELKTTANDKAFQHPKIKTEEEPLPGVSLPNKLEVENLKSLAEEAAEEIRASKKEEELSISFGSELEEPYSDQQPKATKVVLITGATSGIGRATAEEFAKNRDYKLIITGRRAARLEAIKMDFKERFDTDVHILPFDVRDIKSVRKAIDSLENEWKEVDILINNAGLAKGYATIQDGNLEHWEAMIDTNIKGLLYMTHAIIPHMIKRKSGHIINISSSAGKEVYPNGNVYCATKHAVEALTKALRIELHQHNIRVSQVSPGHVEETEFATVRYEDEEKAKIFKDFQPLKAKDVAEALYFITSRPSYVNIQDIVLFGTQQASNIFIDRSGRKDG